MVGFLETDSAFFFTLMELVGAETTIDEVVAARRALQNAKDVNARITRLLANIARRKVGLELLCNRYGMETGRS